MWNAADSNAMPAAAAHPEQLEHEHEQEEEGTKLVESVPQGTAKAKAKAKAKTKSQSPEGRGSDEHDKKEKHGQHQHDHAAVVVQAPIEPSEGPGEEGEFVPIDGWDASSLDDDSGFGGSGSGAESVFDESGSAASSRSSAVSVTSSVYAHEYEHGRRYHSYRHGRYPIPNDDTEQNREDMKHAMVLELTDGRLFYAPIGDNPQRIIDIGTGTGIWAIEVGDKFPSAEVLGLDLSPIQPSWTPPNVRFLVDDAEDDWLNGPDWDLIHFRTMSAVLKNTPKMIDVSFRYLKPGGWIEFQELHPWPCCDDGTMVEDDPLKRFYELALEAFARFRMDLHMARDLGPHLERAGFRNVHCVVKKVPVGPWARDRTLRLVGEYLRLAIVDVIPAFAGKPFESLGLSKERREMELLIVRKTLEDLSIHRYFEFYFWYAQKPE